MTESRKRSCPDCGQVLAPPAGGGDEHRCDGGHRWSVRGPELWRLTPAVQAEPDPLVSGAARSAGRPAAEWWASCEAEARQANSPGDSTRGMPGGNVAKLLAITPLVRQGFTDDEIKTAVPLHPGFDQGLIGLARAQVAADAPAGYAAISFGGPDAPSGAL